ncbi:MAG: CPBP family intramembrane glutamic endopeptidase [Ferruginibacter sp.]
MAHYASKRFTYAGQLGILLAFCAFGLIIGGFLSFLPLLGKIQFSDLMGKDAQAIIEKLMIPQNAGIFRFMQLLSTVFLFCLPTLAYTKLCHNNTLKHLGFNQSVNIKQIGIVILIMLASLPLVGALQEITTLFPWPKAMLADFKAAEVAYNKQVSVIARMNGIGDLLISLIMIALLPAVFEELFFRGGFQNLFTRWFKNPFIAILVTSIIFSAVHGSYLGFLSRAALGFVLGWMYYRTGNIWLNIIAHFTNNALAIIALYISTKPGELTDPSKIDDHFPIWTGLIGIVALVALFKIFEKVNQPQIVDPGKEILLQSKNDADWPFTPTNPNATSHPTT